MNYAAAQSLKKVEFDLRPLRATVAPLFAEYDMAVRDRDMPGSRRRASRAKLEITRTATKELEQRISPAALGLYFFVGAADELAALTYIGIASRGTLLRRMAGRFRDETCLDEQQYGRSREDVWDTAYKRMCVSMGSKTETLVGYAFDHMKTTALFKGADRLIFFVTESGHEVIKAAESLLIYSAVSAGASLINIQEKDKLSTDFGPGVGLAMEIIKLSGIDSNHWCARADLLLSKFRGECC